MKTRNGRNSAAVEKPLPGTIDDPQYPDSDGKPMGETDYHYYASTLLHEALQDYFAPRQDVYVASDLFWYWELGNRRANKAPDTMVIKGVGKHYRRSFRSWEENEVRPCTIFEMVSRKTFVEDTVEKSQLYARLGVKEYFLFDPEGLGRLQPSFQGFRLTRGRYAPLPVAADGSLTSKELGLRLTAENHLLRLHDLRTGRPVLSRQERAEQERQRAEALAAEVARLRRLLDAREQE